MVDPEEFAALAADWRALLREGEERNTVPFFLTGYRDVMARAAALAQIEDLPEDMRRLTGTMLAEHEGHLARDREVRGLVERVRDHWRRWPELGWAASAQGLPIEELAEHDTWREEGVALLEAGRARLGADGEAARHLRAMPGARAGLEEAIEMLERTRLLDNAERFERAWPALREGASEIGVPELHAPGHRLVAELGERLEAAEGIDAHVRRALAEWRAVEAAQVALAEEVRTLPGRIAAWRERRADLPQDEPGGLDPKHPARRAWREEGGALLVRQWPGTCCTPRASTRRTWPPCRVSARRWSRQRAASRARCSRSRRGRRTCCLRSCKRSADELRRRLEGAPR